MKKNGVSIEKLPPELKEGIIRRCDHRTKTVIREINNKSLSRFFLRQRKNVEVDMKRFRDPLGCELLISDIRMIFYSHKVSTFLAFLLLKKLPLVETDFLKN
jgi:hypothetical protein